MPGYPRISARTQPSLTSHSASSSATVIKKRFFIAALSVRNGMPTQSIGTIVRNSELL